jgi:hypothetical protein
LLITVRLFFLLFAAYCQNTDIKNEIYMEMIEWNTMNLGDARGGHHMIFCSGVRVRVCVWQLKLYRFGMSWMYTYNI